MGLEQQLMFQEFLTAEDKLAKNAYILLDDVGVDMLKGKGALLFPYLENYKDYTLIYHDTTPTVNQALFQRKK